MSKIKILSVFHKPYNLLKNDVVIPIHAGREIAFEKSKDGKISKEDYNWLVDNCIGDDTGDNISNLNRYFCELSATYWAWKNYDKLDNPDYMGLIHYRTFFNLLKNDIVNKLYTNCINKPTIKERIGVGSKNICDKLLFSEEFLSELFKKYDGIISEALDSSKIVDVQQTLETNQKYNVITHGKYSHIFKMLDIYKQDNLIHYKNMFVLKKEDFFEYCDFIFDTLFEIKEYYKEKIEPRALGYYAEFLSSLFFVYLKTVKNRNLLEAPWLIIPEKNRNLKNNTKFFFYSALNKYIFKYKNNKLNREENKYTLLV